MGNEMPAQQSGKKTGSSVSRFRGDEAVVGVLSPLSGESEGHLRACMTLHAGLKQLVRRSVVEKLAMWRAAAWIDASDGDSKQKSESHMT